jgi:hypothetical protein
VLLDFLSIFCPNNYFFDVNAIEYHSVIDEYDAPGLAVVLRGNCRDVRVVVRHSFILLRFYMQGIASQRLFCLLMFHEPWLSTWLIS